MMVIPFVRAGQQAGGDLTLDRTHSVQSAGYASPKRMFFHGRVLEDLTDREVANPVPGADVQAHAIVHDLETTGAY